MNQIIEVVYKAKLEDGNWHLGTTRITGKQWKKLKAEKNPKVDIIVARAI